MKTCETSQPSDWQQMELDVSTSSAEGSRARIFPSPVRWPGSMLNEADYGRKSLVWLARYDHHTSSWKTSPTCLLATTGDGLGAFSGTWPRSGMMQSGTAYRLPTLARRMDATVCGLLPTPSGVSNHGQNHVSGRLDEWGGSSNPFRGSEIGKIHSPRFEEWMMGFPDRWTELTGAEMPSSHKSRK